MKKAKCPTCGAKTVEYRHVMNSNLVRALDKFSRAVPPVNLKEVGLTRNEWDNFQKLRYWGLVQRHHAPDGKRVGGTWNLTHFGYQFLLGKRDVPRVAVTYRGELVRYEGVLVSPKDVWPEFRYRQREDYASDATPRFL